MNTNGHENEGLQIVDRKWIRRFFSPISAFCFVHPAFIPVSLTIDSWISHEPHFKKHPPHGIVRTISCPVQWGWCCGDQPPILRKSLLLFLYEKFVCSLILYQTNLYLMWEIKAIEPDPWNEKKHSCNRLICRTRWSRWRFFSLSQRGKVEVL